MKEAGRAVKRKGKVERGESKEDYIRRVGTKVATTYLREDLSKYSASLFEGAPGKATASGLTGGALSGLNVLASGGSAGEAAKLGIASGLSRAGTGYVGSQYGEGAGAGAGAVASAATNLLMGGSPEDAAKSAGISLAKGYGAETAASTVGRMATEQALSEGATQAAATTAGSQAAASAVPVVGGLIGAGLGAAAGNIGIGLALTGVAGLLSPTIAAPDIDNDPRNNNSFSGVQNTSREGIPVPVAYGEVIVGSVVISAGLNVEGN